MGDNGVAGPPAKKRVASRQLCKDDGSESDGETHLSQEGGGAFQRASEEVMAARRIVKVRRPAVSPTSVPNPFAGVRLVPPSMAVGEPPAASAPSGPAAPVSTDSSASGEGAVSLPSVLAPPGLPEGRELKNLDGVHIEIESGKDHCKPEQKHDSKLDLSAIEHVPREMKAEEGRFPGTEDMGNAKENAVDGDEDKVLTGDFIGTSEGESGNIASDENRRVDQLDGQGKEKQVESLDGVEKGDLNDQVVTGYVKEKGENSSLQISKIFSQVSDSVSSGKTGFASSLGSIGTGFSSSNFSFGTAPSSFGTPTGFASFRPSWAFGSGSDSGVSSVSAFAFKASGEGAFSASSTAFGNSNGGTFQLFSAQSSAASSVTAVSSSVPSSTGSFSFQEVPLETGEEQEKVVFAADATLFEFADGGWRERGKGEIKVNVPEDTGGRPRLLMRCKGNYRLLLNASLFPDIKTASMDSRGVTFACVNSAGEGKNGLTTYAVKLKDSLAATGFREAVDTHKGKPHVDLKTPENSPRAPHETVRDAESSEP